MKRRNLFLSLLLVGACTIVGGGYAANVRDFSITGPLSGSINEHNLKVNFQDTTLVVPDPVNNTTVIKATATKASATSANIEVSGMNDIGDTVYCYYLIKNESQATDNLDAKLSTPKVFVTLENGNKADDADVKNDNIFVGHHFTISAKYITGDTNVANATGTVENEGTTAVVKAAIPEVGEQEAVDGQTMWLLVEVSLRDIIIDDFEKHSINISFSATTI